MSGGKKKRRAQAPNPLFNIQQAASMTECTGILPAQIQTEDQGANAAALESTFPILPPDGD